MSVHIITASAGSGKTWRLAQELLDAVTSGAARPDAIVATTFTNKAAAELQERARRRLLEAGRAADAQRLLAARMGTVNAVCGQLVEELAFELGLPPSLVVFDEKPAEETLRRVLDDVVTGELERELNALKGRMPDLEWHTDVRRIIDIARANDVGAAALRACAPRSIESLLALLGPPEADGGALDAALAEALGAFVDAVDTGLDRTQDTNKYLDVAKRALPRARRGDATWADWLRLEKDDVGARTRALAEPVREAAAAHDRHPRLRDDLRRWVTAVYEVAARALDAYQARKRELGVLDFVDQEAYALALLRRPEVRERLRGEIDLVLVNEFQDTSPLQLAIFLELASIAPRSVWVGDPKQSIFGFRGTDPKLMDAAIQELCEGPNDPELVASAVAALAGGGPAETLRTSYRSRPELVRLTSDLFARAFAAHGLTEERVRLEPARDTEPPGLGPIAEHWRLEIPNVSRTTDLAPALAAGIASLLAAGADAVRDPATGEARPARAADVAVLCRTNEECERVARALRAHGVAAVVPRLGLMSTAEARVAAAALRLWIDPGDALAAAELARIVSHPDRPDAWLQRLVNAPGRAAFADDPTVRAIAAASAAQPTLGVLDAFDAAVEAAGLPELCRAWGDTAQRLANVNALRAQAVACASRAAAERRPATLAGLLAHLDELTVEDKWTKRSDHQAVLAAEDAVVVSTWHRAKGLEWPIAILFGLERMRDARATGVHVASDRAAIDLADPLAGRWVRYWPTPYHPGHAKALFHERLAASPEQTEARDRGRREALRLLYVGWTRARDRVVLAAQEGKLLAGALRAVTEIDPSLLAEPGERTVWGGRPVNVRVRVCAPEDPPAPPPAPGRAYLARAPGDLAPAFVRPSALAAAGAAGDVHALGDRLPLRGSPDMNALGQALHGFLAADDPAAPVDARRAMARGLLERWRVAGALEPADLVEASDRLARWLAATWPGAAWRREWPLHHRLASGSVVRGAPDLVVDAGATCAVIDHKSFPGALADSIARAAGHAGQLRAYADALCAAGFTRARCFVHLPIVGVVAEVHAAP